MAEGTSEIPSSLIVILTLKCHSKMYLNLSYGEQWNFRIGFTPREGLVIYSVAYIDGSRGRRPVAHRLSFVEMVVPYGDPNEPHYRKNAFDAGEDGLGKNAHSLKKVNSTLICLYSCYIGSSASFQLNSNVIPFGFRGATVWAILNTLMPILQISLEVLRRLRTVFACMKRIMGYYGSIKIGGQV